ncbi:C45 family autoproteolytic acyltransferase/hydrolase [Planctomycetota bacterium]|nr:C45 family autoproteolytic acyltransferase/hydrolase [Planctomycetota bacterium]
MSYKIRGNVLTDLVRSLAAYGLLTLQLLGFLLVLEIPYWLWDRFVSNQRGDAFYRTQKSIARWFFRLFPFGDIARSRVRSRNFPHPCVIVCNHQSMLDMLVVLLLPVNARWMIGSWAKRIPLMGEISTLARHILISEKRGRVDRPRGIEDGLRCLKNGISIVAWPEGKRSPNGDLLRFKRDAFQLAIEAGVPIVPVVLDGTGATMPRGHLLLHRPNLKLDVLSEVSTEGMAPKDARELAGTVRSKMAAHLKESRESHRRSIPIGAVSRLMMAGVATILLALVGLSQYVKTYAIATPPEHELTASEQKLIDTDVREFGKGQKQLGMNWFRKRDALREMGLSGTDWERGYANAMMTRDILKEQEDVLQKLVREFLPNKPSQWLVKNLIAVNNKQLPEYLTDGEKLEIKGLADGSVDNYPDEFPLYHRIMNYHAAHDISHMLIDSPLIATKNLIGCTGFAAWGSKSVDGHLLIARNFDWEAGTVFDEKKIVYYVWPESGHAYVHVAWAGMVGAVTGMNEHGLSVHINAARTDDTGFGNIGTPVSLLVKRVLNECETLDQAVKMITDAKVFVSDSYLVGSAKEGRAVIVEKSPEVTAVHEGKDLLLQSNHFIAEEFANDAENAAHQETATTTQRLARLTELAQSDAKLDAAGCLAILRDKKVAGGEEVGFGNRNAIDASIATHSVVMDLTAGKMWVGVGPYTFGRYLVIDVVGSLQAGPDAAQIMRRDADDNLDKGDDNSGGLNVDEFRDMLEVAGIDVETGNTKRLKLAIKNMRIINPKCFELAYFEGRLAELEDKPKVAVQAFERALALHPHYDEVRNEIQQRIDSLK